MADHKPHEAEIAKWEAEAHAAAALAEWNEQQARKAELEAADLELKLELAQEKRTKELAADEWHHVYRFTSPVASSSVDSCMKQLSLWHRLEPNCGIELVFCSPGGDVISGMALFDYIGELRDAGHHFTTRALGYAASMAGILLQAGDVRIMAPQSWLLIHEASFGATGSYGDVEDTVDWVRRVQERILDIFAERSNLTKRQIKQRWHRKDWWISSDQALKFGFVDEVR